jgi:hypothetical protein
MASILTAAEIRMFLRDYATAVDSGLTYVFNELLDHVAFSTAELALAEELAVARFNATGHLTAYASGTFPNKFVLMIGTCSNLMFSNAMLQARNQLDYNDGGEHHGYSDKYQAYLQIKDALNAQWTEIVPMYKAALNLEGGYGSLPSAYAGFGYPSLVSNI